MNEKQNTRQMGLRLLELAGICEPEPKTVAGKESVYWNVLIWPWWSIAPLCITCIILVLVYYWNNSKIGENEGYSSQGSNTDPVQDDLGSETDWDESSTTQSVDVKELPDMTFLYCPNGCQGACACPTLEGWLIDPHALSSPQKAMRQRAHLLLGKFLIYPEYLQQIFEEDEKIVDTLERKLDALFNAKERASLSSSSSLICSLASRQLQDAPLRRINAGMITRNNTSMDVATDIDSCEEQRHSRKRLFRKVLSSGKDGKFKERSGTV